VNPPPTRAQRQAASRARRRARAAGVLSRCATTARHAPHRALKSARRATALKANGNVRTAYPSAVPQDAENAASQDAENAASPEQAEPVARNVIFDMLLMMLVWASMLLCVAPSFAPAIVSFDSVVVPAAATTLLLPHAFYLGASPTSPLASDSNGGFTLKVRVHLWAQAASTATVSMACAAATSFAVSAGDYNVTLSLSAPPGAVKLWCPACLGAQPLCTVNATVDAGGAAAALTERRVGLSYVGYASCNDTNSVRVVTNVIYDGIAEPQGLLVRANVASLSIFFWSSALAGVAVPACCPASSTAGVATSSPGVASSSPSAWPSPRASFTVTGAPSCAGSSIVAGEAAPACCPTCSTAGVATSSPGVASSSPSAWPSPRASFTASAPSAWPSPRASFTNTSATVLASLYTPSSASAAMLSLHAGGSLICAVSVAAMMALLRVRGIWISLLCLSGGAHAMFPSGTLHSLEPFGVVGAPPILGSPSVPGGAAAALLLGAAVGVGAAALRAGQRKPAGGGSAWRPCDMYGVCGARIRDGSHAVEHYRTCHAFLSHRASQRLNTYGPFSSYHEAVACAKQLAPLHGISSRGTRFTCSVSHKSAPSPVFRPSPLRVPPEKLDTTSAHRERAVERGRGVGRRATNKGHACEAMIYIKEEGGHWEVILFSYHCHVVTDRLGSYDTGLRSDVAAALKDDPALSSRELTALVLYANPSRRVTPRAVAMHHRRLHAALRPPPGRPFVAQLFDLARVAHANGAIVNIKMPDVGVKLPTWQRAAAPSVFSAAWQLARSFFGDPKNQGALGHGELVAIVTDKAGLADLANSKAGCMCVLSSLLPPPHQRTLPPRLRPSPTAPPTRAPRARCSDKSWNFAVNATISATVVVSFRAPLREPAAGATRDLLNCVPPVLREFAAAALHEARRAAAADLVVGRVPTLSAIMIATRGDAATTFCGFTMLRELVWSHLGCDVGWLSVVQDADQADATAIAAAFPSVQHVRVRRYTL
jgi:hypothetical protein